MPAPAPSPLDAARSAIVLKFGSSVIPSEADLPVAVHEIYRHLRQGRRVVAVVSAFGSTTDDLIAHARAYRDPPSDDVTAAFLATGEQRAGALLALALEKAGIPARVADPGMIGLTSRGSSLDSTAVDLNAEVVHRLLAQTHVLIVPGFYARREDWSISLLGRGGSDLTALFIAGKLGAECILLKDVDGLYDRDPNVHADAQRFDALSYEDLLRLPEGVVQHKAARYARDHAIPFRVGASGSPFSTRVGNIDSARCPRPPRAAPLRVALAGLGSVGMGVYQHLVQHPDRFEVIGISVRDTARQIAAGIPAWLFRHDPVALATDPRADIVIELIGGAEPARSVITAALAAGKHVVTGNKRILAEDDGSLPALAVRNHVHLHASAAVGGAVPMLELVKAARLQGQIRSIRGIVNGTTNYILSRMESGDPYDAVLADAQRLGYAEADPSADIDGHDAAQKIALLAREAFDQHVPLSSLLTHGIRGLDPAVIAQRIAAGQRTRLIAQATQEHARVHVSVSPQVLDSADPLYHALGTENRIAVTLENGQVFSANGSGAGRWPTSEAVFADLMDIWRAVRGAPTAHLQTPDSAAAPDSQNTHDTHRAA